MVSVSVCVHVSVCHEIVQTLGAEIIIRMKCRLQDFKYFGQV